jgi:hypothetical protein
VRRKELLAHSLCGKRCEDCPGPESPESACHTWKGVALGKANWPMCPVGMTRVKAWSELTEVAFAQKATGAVEPLTAWGHAGLLELHAAIREEEARRLEAARGKGQGGANTVSPRGRRSTGR